MWIHMRAGLILTAIPCFPLSRFLLIIYLSLFFSIQVCFLSATLPFETLPIFHLQNSSQTQLPLLILLIGNNSPFPCILSLFKHIACFIFFKKKDCILSYLCGLIAVFQKDRHYSLFAFSSLHRL